MEKSQGDYCQKIDKHDIKLKPRPKNGVILQLHNTVRGPHGECRRFRFTIAAFDDEQEKIACADNAGNVFILDFSDMKFWKLKEIGPCTAMNFVHKKIDTLIVATPKLDIKLLDIETGKTSLTLTGHTASIKTITFSKRHNSLLTASSVEAILWEIKNYTKFFTLNTYIEARIQQICFTPAGEYLVACFKNDTLQIWKHESLKSVKQIIPNDLKHMKCIAFTKNGRAMAMAGLTPLLILFNMDTWKVIKNIHLIKYNISSVLSIAFIPQVFDGGANKILGMLTSDCALKIFNLENLTIIHTIKPYSSGVKNFLVSPTGKFFLCILTLGEVNIYNSSFITDMENIEHEKPTTVQEQPSTSLHRKHVLEATVDNAKIKVQQKMRACLDSTRLRRILVLYGEYPDKYRAVIWESLLNIPRNKTAYSALLDKGIHPAFKEIEKQFTIYSQMTLKNLKRLLSCLAHWCPLFGVMKFIPAFVFPFVKILQHDPLVLFEVVATVLLNYCQLWFEYAPFPPISVLSMIENVLAEFDQQLLDFYCQNSVTSQTYALNILETAFSEVLSSSEWLFLWDHILSNEPAFILMAVVSYNIVHKNAIKNCKTSQEFNNFFHMQNPINKKMFLKRAYMLLNDTPDEIHPRKFLRGLVALEKGDCYQQFRGYPKATICLKLAENERKKVKKYNSKCTLNDLTKKSQEKIIRQEKSKDECLRKNSPKSIYEGDDVEVYFNNNNKLRHHLEESSRHKDDYKKSVRDELIESIMFPSFVPPRLSNKNSSAALVLNKNNNPKTHKTVNVTHNESQTTKRSEINSSFYDELQRDINNLILSESTL